jgi:uncharacterized protein with ParB-like and HNH nuclease domain
MPNMVKTTSQIFANQIFRVPDYQRGYAWEKRQWNDLLEDLDLIQGDRTHFTGTLILQKNGNNAKKVYDHVMKAYDQYDVIDGQQRLTTIIILLKSIYEEFIRIPSLVPLAENLKETYLSGIDQNNQPFSKLSLNDDSNKFFFDNILDVNPGISGPKIKSHERLLGAKEYFKNYLSQKNIELGEDYHNWLQKFYKKIIHQLTLIVYPIDDEADSGTIFETMNDRGRPLTELEKVKNYLLYVSSKLDLKVDHDLTETINWTLKFVYEQLMAAGLASRESEDQLLRANWLLFYDYDISRWDNARSIKAKFGLRSYQNQHPELLEDLKDYLSKLNDTVTAYCDIYTPSRNTSFNNISNPTIKNEIILWSQKLVRLGVRASYLPLLIAVRLNADDDGASYLQTLQHLEKYTYRVFYWRRARSNAGQTALFRLGHTYYRNPNTELTLEEINQLGFRYCTNEFFNDRFNLENENWYEWSGINYFLYEYEHFLAKGKPVKLTWETITSRAKSSSIEHILPQTPEDIYWLDRFSKEKHLRWKNDIGNLTLTFDNSKLGNKRFPLKKGNPGQDGCYANSPLFIERELAKYQDWSEEEIKHRRSEIVNWAKERWKVDSVPRQSKASINNMEEMFEKAEEFGLNHELVAIHQAATNLGMWPTIRKGIQYRHPKNYRRSTVVVYVEPAGFTIYFYHENFAYYKGVSEEEAREILEVNNGWNWFSRDRIMEAVEALNRFHEFLETKKQK